MRRLAPLLVLLLVAACGTPVVAPPDAGDDTPLDAGAGTDAGDSSDGGGGDGGRADGGLDAGSGDAGPGPSLVTVGHQRELRGVWIATVANLDWPSSQALSPDAGKASLTALVDTLADAGMNALFFQVRPESDALYASALEPWSRYLTGTQGQNPGWDPLEELLRAAHARGLEVHAWLNPYRGLVSASASTATNHVTRTLSGYAIPYNNAVVMNPGEPAVRQHVRDVVRDLLGRYDVDGLHFDDYFYPYPDSSGTPFPDTATYNGYVADGGTLTRPDWRRDNVNTLIREVMGVVRSDAPHVRFGVSPFGIWKSGTPPGISGLSAYETISCDGVAWMNEGTVDYLAPQLYWPIGGAQDYERLSTWWAQGTMAGRHLFPGHATYRLGTTSAWTLAEYRAQVTFTRTLRASNALGDLHFRAADIRTNRQGVFGLLANELYARPALPPPVPRTGAAVTPPTPLVARAGTSLTVTSPLPLTVRFYALYREVAAGQWELQRVSGGPQATFTVTAGTWAVSAIGRGGGESQGLRVVVP